MSIIQGTQILDLRQEVLRLKLNDLSAKSREHHAQLKTQFPISGWEEAVWVYCGKDNLFTAFSDEDLTQICKVFITEYLWDARLANKLHSFSFIRGLVAVFRTLEGAGFSGIHSFSQDLYSRTINNIVENYQSAEGVVNRLNLIVKFLLKHQLIIGSIDTISGTKLRTSHDKYGRVASPDKQPLPEVIRAIIQLKWAVEDQPMELPRSPRQDVDALMVYAQIFQFALGMRIGEVLRMPCDCLVEKDGEAHSVIVWAEKGSEPQATYIPRIWRPAVMEAVSKIKEITDIYRARARAIEDSSFQTEMDQRFAVHVASKERDMDEAYAALDELIEKHKAAALAYLTPLTSIADHEEVELRNLGQYLPFARTYSDAYSLAKYYRANGLRFDSVPIGKIKRKHVTTGADIKNLLSTLLAFAEKHLSFQVVYSLVMGVDIRLPKTKDEFVNELTFTKVLTDAEMSAVNADTRGGGRWVGVTIDGAKELIKRIYGGRYNYRKFLLLKDAETLFPEYFNQKTADYLHSERKNEGFYDRLTVIRDQRVYVKNYTKDARLRFTKVSGYLVDFESIKSAVEFEFVASNTRLSSELVEDATAEMLEIGLEMSSRSFSINQRVSEFLFLMPGTRGGVYQPHIPSIATYWQVQNVFKPAEGKKSAFERYGVEVSPEVVQTYQSHKARHWQTTSLFRSGLSASIVNKWMKRSDSQGDHYDHRTARERAAMVSEHMLSEQDRLIGAVPDRVRAMMDNQIPLESIQEFLTGTLRTAHYSPLGLCVRDINLKPCEYHLKCLTGNEGKGCREYVYDLHDPVHRANVEAERNKACLELERLFEVMNRPNIPHEAIEAHVGHQMTIYRNATSVLEKAEVILMDDQVELIQDIKPFMKDGSKPDDCVFQCGSNTNTGND